MLTVVKDFPDIAFAVAGVPSLGEDFYKNLMPGSEIPVVMNNTYELLGQASAALVTSGTATLETALIGTPEVVCYKGGMVSYLIARQVIKVKFISLVNLIMDRLVVKELIQKELNRKNLKAELGLLLNDIHHRRAVIEGFNELRVKLGGSGASAKAAAVITDFLNKK